MDPDSTRSQLDKILASGGFATADSLSRFLRYVVDQTLTGQADRIKEYIIGVQVFGRGESFDPRVDPIVRVQAGKLRSKLNKYYETAGLHDPVRIEIPKGSYAPVIRAAQAPQRNRKRLAVAAALLVATGALTVWALTRSAPNALPAGPDAEAASIAILPFANMSDEKDQDYFCDGITEEIGNVLSRVAGLRVTARTSAFAFQGTKEDVRQIGAKLGVGMVLEGSVRKSGDRLRVTAQLVSTKDGYRLWSETYEGPVQDVFAIQDRIAGAIANALEVNLSIGPEGVAANRYFGNLPLYELYLKGRYFLNGQPPSSLDTAESYFEQVIQMDPNFAPAWVGLAAASESRGENALAPPTEMMRKARAAVERALQIDDSLADAHSVLGGLMVNFAWDWAGGAREFDRAIQLNPNLSSVHLGRSRLYMIEGRFAEMEESILQAQLLDPLSRAIGVNFSHLYYYSRRPDRMIGYCSDPSVGWMVFCRGTAYISQGRIAEGIDLLEKSYRMRGDPGQGFGMLALQYARVGRRDDALRLIAEAKALSRERYISPFSLATAYLGLGDKDEVFAWLDKAFEARDPKMVSLRVDPTFDPIRSDPRFAALLERMHL